MIGFILLLLVLQCQDTDDLTTKSGVHSIFESSRFTTASKSIRLIVRTYNFKKDHEFGALNWHYNTKNIHGRIISTRSFKTGAYKPKRRVDPGIGNTPPTIARPAPLCPDTGPVLLVPGYQRGDLVLARPQCISGHEKTSDKNFI